MTTTANNFATVGASVDRAGATAWTSPGNIVSDNATNTTSAVPTDYLVCSAFGFTIPTDSVIRGITVRVDVSETGSGTSDFIPQLISATVPTLIGSAKAAQGVNGAQGIVTVGGVADLWSATLTPAIVNDAGFGVAIWSTDTTNTLAIDFVTIAVTYEYLATQLASTVNVTGIAPSTTVTNFKTATGSLGTTNVTGATQTVTLHRTGFGALGTTNALGYAPVASKWNEYKHSLGTTSAVGYAASVEVIVPQTGFTATGLVGTVEAYGAGIPSWTRYYDAIATALATGESATVTVVYQPTANAALGTVNTTGYAASVEVIQPSQPTNVTADYGVANASGYAAAVDVVAPATVFDATGDLGVATAQGYEAEISYPVIQLDEYRPLYGSGHRRHKRWLEQYINNFMEKVS